MPPAELELWQRLKLKSLDGLKFRRQYGVGPFVVDFFCPKLNLAIELDGDSHFGRDAVDYDQRRQKYIERNGIHFLRFLNPEVYENIEGVLETIRNKAKWLKEKY